MDGHVSDGAQKEGCWECSKVSEHPRGPGSGRALSAQGAGTTASAGSQLQLKPSARAPVRFAVEGPRQDGKGTGPRVQVPARPAAWPGSHWGCSPLLCPSWHSGPSRAQVRPPPAAPYTCLWECHSIPTAWVCRARPPPPFRAWAHPTPTPQGVAHGTKPLRQSCCPVRGVAP